MSWGENLPSKLPFIGMDPNEEYNQEREQEYRDEQTRRDDEDLDNLESTV